MKTRNLLFYFAVGVIVVVMIVLLLGKRKPIATPLAKLISNAPVAATPNLAPTQYVSTNSNAASMSNSAAANYHEKVVGLLSTYNDVPISFYGRLEDQHGGSVPYATVNFIVRVDSGTESSVIRSKTTADGNGAFSIAGYHGQDLSIVPQKSGYALATSDTFFKYSHLEDHPYVSDANNPTIIKMWKLEGAEPLMGINQRYRFYYTNGLINFDLLAGQLVANGGDIQIMVNRSPGIISGRSRQDWSVQVRAIDGGIIQDNGQEGIAFEAPESGYEESDTFIMSTNYPYKWLGSFDQTFFIKSRNGQIYSRLNFGISINANPNDYVWVELHGFANTNSSRNWEAAAPK